MTTDTPPPKKRGRPSLGEKARSSTERAQSTRNKQREETWVLADTLLVAAARDDKFADYYYPVIKIAERITKTTIDQVKARIAGRPLLRQVAGKVRNGEMSIEEAFALYASTSEKICIALAAGRRNLAPEPYCDDIAAAWNRLDAEQQGILADMWPSELLESTKAIVKAEKRR